MLRMEDNTPPTRHWDLCSSSSSTKGRVRMFDCTICGGSLEQPGPSLESFSFGKLLLAINQLSFSEQEVIYREFSIFDQLFSNGFYDCSKVLSTSCGHLFHSGCIREWYFMRRLDRIKKCPFCNQRTSYDECWIIHATACSSSDKVDDNEPPVLPIPNEEDDDKHLQPGSNPAVPEYSDISCASSSFGESDSDDETELEEQENEDDTFDHPSPTSTDENENEPAYADAVLQTDPHPNDLQAARKNNDIKKALRFIDKVNLIHTPILISTIRSACFSYQTRKARFLEMLDYVEDEDLAEKEASMIPLGFDFLQQLIITAILIWFIEKVRNIFIKK